MSLSQVRVKLVVAAGVVGASLLAATFVGCQSDPTSQAQNGQFGNRQFGNNQFANNQPGGNQYAASPFNGAPNGGQQMAAAGGAPNGFPPQNQQAFLNETQRLGTQQNLSAQDLVAMSRSGVPDQQIAMAVQQRGAALRTTPGVPQYLAQNGVNPAVLGQGPAAGSNPPAFGTQTAMTDPPTSFGSPAFGQNPTGGRPAFANAPGAGVTAASYPTAQGDATQVQSAGFESTLASPSLDASTPPANGSMTGQSWRPMPR